MKPKFTFDEHTEAGAELFELRRQLMTVATKVRAAYPKSSFVCRKATMAVKALDGLRCGLADCICREHGNADCEEVLRLYYPGPQGQPLAGTSP